MKSWRTPTRRLLLEELEGRVVPSVTTSTNWSGYAVTAANGAVTAVSGTWVVPTLTKSSAAGYSASWVGIDGFNSSTVEQTGTEADYVNGQISYSAWYEMYPANPVTLSTSTMTVHPGDTMSASVTYASNVFTLTLTDVTTKQSFKTTKSGTYARSSAEWIVEAPWENGVLPLAGFGTETFSAATATINNQSGPISTGWAGTQLEQINMVNQRGTPIDSTSALSSNGAGFTVTDTSSSTTSGSGSGSSSGSGHHHGGGGFGSSGGWGWWFGTEQPAVTASELAAAAATSNSTPRLLAPTVTTTVPTPQAIASQAALSASLAGGGGNRTVLVAPAQQEAAMPEVPPDAPQPGTPVVPPKPDAQPEAPPMPPAPPDAATVADATLACDLCFSDGRWAPIAPGDGASALGGQGDEDGSGLPRFAGMLFTLSLGGAWGIAREQGAERRRRQGLR
jgi:hypothetical protein